jgi:hypothetical protein
LRTALARQLDGRSQPLNDRRARAIDEMVRPGSRYKPLKGESRTWLRGEINPQGRERSKPSRACETLRADRRARHGKLAYQWTLSVDVAMGKENPKEGATHLACGAGLER